ATGGRNRMTVPARPTSTLAGPRSEHGRTTHSSSSAVLTVAPMARSPAAISSVSRARSGARRVLDPADTAPSTRGRAVIDWEPASRTVAETGLRAVGAVHGRSRRCEASWPSRVPAELLSATRTVCRSGVDAGSVVAMCGRYATTRSAADLSALFDAGDQTDDGLAPDYHLAPTDPVPVVRRSRRVEHPVLSVARWGLVPSWARDASGAARMINARAETVATARAYATSFASRRCLVPADGWYEWVRRSSKERQPYFM